MTTRDEMDALAASMTAQSRQLRPNEEPEMTTTSYPKTLKAIADEFAGPNNAGVRKMLRESILAGTGVPSLRSVGLTAFGKASLAKVKEAYESEAAPQS
jgi:hypothetical protein